MTTRERPQALSRRTFLKASAFGLTAAALTACVPAAAPAGGEAAAGGQAAPSG